MPGGHIYIQRSVLMCQRLHGIIILVAFMFAWLHVCMLSGQGTHFTLNNGQITYCIDSLHLDQLNAFLWRNKFPEAQNLKDKAGRQFLVSQPIVRITYNTEIQVDGQKYNVFNTSSFSSSGQFSQRFLCPKLKWSFPTLYFNHII